MPSTEYVKAPPRLSVEITEELAFRFSNAVPWGLRSRVMSIMLEDLLDMIDREGDIVTTALLNRAIKAEHILKEIPKKGG